MDVERGKESVTTVSIVQKNEFLKNDSKLPLYSFNAILRQEVQFNDTSDDQLLNNLSIENLNMKLDLYYKLFKENKINMHNAFDINAISYIHKMVKTRDLNFMEMSNILDVMNKVYTCRVDNLCMSMTELAKSMLAEKSIVSKNQLKENVTEIRPRKNLMLTTPDKLRRKDNREFKKTKYLSSVHNNDTDYANPSRTTLNKFFNLPYWPEYNRPREDNTNTDKEEKYEMEDLSDTIKNGKICPRFHGFVDEYDSYAVDDDRNKLYNATRFNQEISTFKDGNLIVDNSEEHHKPMNIDIDNQNSEIVIHAGSSSSSNDTNISIKKQKSLDLSKNLNVLKQKTGRYQYRYPLRKSCKKSVHGKRFIDLMDKCSTTSSENESTELNNVASLSLPVLSSAQDDSSENGDKLGIITVENHSSNESDTNMIAIIDDNSSNINNSHNIQEDDTNEEINIFRCIDMYTLKECILNIIKPDGKITLTLTFKDLLQRLPELLPKNTIDNINVSVIYVALLHLANEHNFNIETKSNDLIISQN